jgi:hypothetical protein
MAPSANVVLVGADELVELDGCVDVELLVGLLLVVGVLVLGVLVVVLDSCLDVVGAVIG